MRTISIGDVHGCIEELRDLLQLIDYKPGSDRLVLLGDLIDRGPDPAGVVRIARTELGAECLMGNHEEKMLRWRLHESARSLAGRPNPMRAPWPTRLAEWEQLSPDDLDWLSELPTRIVLDQNWIAVHAGMEPGRGVYEQSDDTMIRIRRVGPDGLRDKPAERRPVNPSCSYPWARWPGPWRFKQSVVYGHAVHSMIEPRVDRAPSRRQMAYGIDTGCCFGGQLTALILDGSGVEFASVPARAEYAGKNR